MMSSIRAAARALARLAGPIVAPPRVGEALDRRRAEAAIAVGDATRADVRRHFRFRALWYRPAGCGHAEPAPV